MKHILIVGFCFSFATGCVSKKRQLYKEISQNKKAQMILFRKIAATDTALSQYAESDDTVKASMALAELVTYIREKDSLGKVYDSLTKEAGKYK